ncbi:DUF3656 domain-containing protein [Herbivorax sp. ANBcel31]|uniref:DUF3656 domain-containing U32 family peptidase n=1 Tax=Herbivorax sp. ANBcel31 TaxID=3069754 RepID=UPI0027B048A4|nr:U32 family peptidase [Herbivorax sp. ANBcel31]MDQ2086351.1 DUF3656 domain-containing protein [Herbivorax sp. ANBcel31]
MQEKSNVELLAPCGSWQSFLAAVENGADAVYLGGKDFSARQLAANFDKDKLIQSIKYAHIRNVNVYLTMNTLISDKELKSALEFLNEVYYAGIDGVIVQDLGFAREVKKFFPKLHLHGSTQMTISSLEAVKVLEDLDFNRVVLARELSLGEIANISKNTTIETEVFVHGALCISYSGQCLMSSVIGGRSGNRGKCAQPCRLMYQLFDENEKVLEKSYLLSPKDLCSLYILNEMVDTGVKSLKIEGRMKSPEYVAVAVRVYRKYLNKILEGEKNYKECVDKNDMKDLTQIFNRGGFTQGHLKEKTGKSMMCFEKPKNWGIYLGDVISYDRHLKAVTLKLKEELSIGDGIEVWNGEDKSPGTVVTLIKSKKRNVRNCKAGEVASIADIKGKISKGDKVYKTSSSELNRRATETFTGKLIKKIPIEGEIDIFYKEPAVFTVKDYSGNKFTEKSTKTAERAINRSLTKERIIEQAEKTGGTPFEFKKININLHENVSLPVSEINRLRRKVLEGLETCRADKYKRVLLKKIDNLSCEGEEKAYKYKSSGIAVYFYKSDKDANYYCVDADRVYLPIKMFRDEKKLKMISYIKKRVPEVFISIPPIIRGNYQKLLKSRLDSIVDSGVDGFLTGNIGALKRIENIKVIGDYSLNVFNSSSICTLKELGFSGATLSYEMNLNQIKNLRDLKDFQKEVLVYGRIPVMTSQHCSLNAVKGCKSGCREEKLYLKDRKGMNFPVMLDNIDCRTTIFNSKVLLCTENIDKIESIDMLRLSFTDEEPSDIKSIVNMYRDIIKNKDSALSKNESLIKKIKENGFTKGHFLKGV